MNYKMITLCCIISVGLTQQSNAAEVLGKKLEIYGKAHLSIDRN